MMNGTNHGFKILNVVRNTGSGNFRLPIFNLESTHMMSSLTLTIGFRIVACSDAEHCEHDYCSVRTVQTIGWLVWLVDGKKSE